MANKTNQDITYISRLRNHKNETLYGINNIKNSNLLRLLVSNAKKMYHRTSKHYGSSKQVGKLCRN